VQIPRRHLFLLSGTLFKGVLRDLWSRLFVRPRVTERELKQPGRKKTTFTSLY
jgi:hypothetical protein